MKTEVRSNDFSSMRLRDSARQMWADSAAAWGDHAESIDERVQSITSLLINRTEPRPGDNVLDLACGAGGTGIAFAPIVGENGNVTLSDVATEMVTIAANRAQKLGLQNVDTAIVDLDEIQMADETFDIVVCREGLMFAFDPRSAARNILRILRPGGRFAATVWDNRGANPWLGIVFGAVTAEIGMPMPPPGIPGPFALGNEQELGSILSDAGFANPLVTGLDLTICDPTFDVFWATRTSLAGPLSKRLAGLPPEQQIAIRERARQAARQFETETGLAFPARSLVASGQRLA